MENSVDWRFAIELLIPGAKHGWLNPDSFSDVLGKYEYIDWRDNRKKPTKNELISAWEQYIIQNGTFEQQELDKQQKRDAAIASLKLSTDKNIIDLLEIIL